MSCYWLNRKEILQKAKERYSKEKLLNIIYKTKKQKRKVKELIQKLVKRRKRQD